MTAAADMPLRDCAVLRDHEFERFRDLIFRIAGISMSREKKALVSSRLAKRLRHFALSSYGEYFHLITQPDGAQELQVAVDLLTTNETHFFREPRHFDFLRKIAQNARSRPFRVWSAACSSGEEAYTIAMVLDDVLGEAPWEIAASDISTRMLDKARSGLYPIDRAHEIPRAHLARRCLKGTGAHAGSFLVERALRQRVRFFQHNLTEEAPALGEFDAIFLRNVMIYFNLETKRQVVGRLLPLLRSGGHFIISHSETLNGVYDGMAPVQPAVYRKP